LLNGTLKELPPQALTMRQVVVGVTGQRQPLLPQPRLAALQGLVDLR
jgi:hypothetical protein